MKIGDIYDKDGLKGVVVSVDYTGCHGLIMSLDEVSLNWHEADKWCKQLGEGWFMPSLVDFDSMKNDHNLRRIQETLIRKGMPLCFGDTTYQGTNKGGHMYWSKDLQGSSSGSDYMYVFCLRSSGFSGVSSDYKESDYEYIRAMHRF